VTEEEFQRRVQDEAEGLREPHIPIRVHLARLTYLSLGIIAVGFLVSCAAMVALL
jgi:hypothetical protein